MYTGSTATKGHKTSNALKRHGLRMRNQMTSCSKSLWMIGFIVVVILIAISTTVIRLGQDLMYAEKAEQETHSHSNNVDNNQHITQRLKHYNTNNNNNNNMMNNIANIDNIDNINDNDIINQENNINDNDNDDDDDDDDDNEEDTERMDVNGEEVNIKKSEIQRVWKEVESELKERNEKNDRQFGHNHDNDKDDHNHNQNDSDVDDDDHDDKDVDNDNDIDDNNDDNDDENDVDDDDDDDDDDIDDNKHKDVDDDNDDNDDDDDDIDDDKHKDVDDNDDNDDENDNEDNDDENENNVDGDNDKITKKSLTINNEQESNDREKNHELISLVKHEIDNNEDNEDKDAAKVFDSENKESDDDKEKRYKGPPRKKEFDQEKDNDDNKEDKVSLDSEDLERVLYGEYFELPTFFDIDGDDVDGLVKYWKQSGKAHYDKFTTKFREIQDDDLKETIMHQDDHHNNKLSYIYDVNSDDGHSWNVDYNYLYPFMYPLESYPKELLREEVFHYNLTRFINEEIGRPKSRYAPKWDIYEIYAANGDKYKRIISKEAMYEKHEKYLRENYKDVELIFPENDTLLFSMLNKFGQRLKENILNEESKSNTSESNHGGIFLRALKKMEDEGSSPPSSSSSSSKNDKDGQKEIAKRRRRLEGFGVLDRDNDKNKPDLNKINMDDIGESTKEDIDRPRIHNFNGVTSDITYLHRNRSSTQYYHNLELDDPMKVFMAGNMGFDDKMEKENLVLYKNNRFWRLHEHCVRRKSMTIYPNWRILYASKPLTCNIILTKLLDPISKCLMSKGWKCELLLDYGYFRFVFKSEAKAKYLYSNPKDPEQIIPIVLKVMKTEFVDWSADWMRHIREAIFLQQLGKWEIEFIDKYGVQFQSLGQDRAFYYVPELGHCLYPTYITVTPFYNMTLKKFTRNEHTANMTLRAVAQKAMEILSGLQIMHNIEGGPYQHTDIQPRQFMIDDNNNVLINDFNRGKFTEYYFKNAVEGKDENNNKDIIIPCTYCMPYSHGHYRAPEEYYSDPLNEGLDLWSICYTVWNLFSFEKPWSSIGNNYEAIKYLLHDYQMRPKLPYSIPPFLKDMLRHCWRQNIYHRPDINELMRDFRYFYKHIHRLSDGKQHFTLYELQKTKAFKETNFPDMEMIREYT